MDGEEAWVETLAFMTQSGTRLYSLGARELASLERCFAQDTKTFLARHQAARDEVEDSMWITKYLSYGSYCTILLLAGLRLHWSRLNPDENRFSSGDFVIITGVYLKFGSNLAKVNNSVIKMVRAGVALGRIEQLLNLPEHESKRMAAEKEEAQGSAVPDFSTTVSKDKLVFEGVAFQAKENQPIDSVNFGPTTRFVPLNKIVRVIGGSESQEFAFLALTAGLVSPTSGHRVCPRSVSTIMLSRLPLGYPHITAQDALMLSGLPKDMAERLTIAFDIDPGRFYNRLAPGQSQTLSLVRAILRGADIVVASRSMALVPEVQKRKLTSLLKAWQQGYSYKAIGAWLSGSEDAERGPAKTLVVTEDFQLYNDSKGTIVEININDWLVADTSSTVNSQMSPGTCNRAQVSLDICDGPEMQTTVYGARW